MKTSFILMAQYDGLAVIPLERVCNDYFKHLTPQKLARKIESGDIALPMVRMETSQKSARGIGLQHLADYLDKRLAAAARDMQALAG